MAESIRAGKKRRSVTSSERAQSAGGERHVYGGIVPVERTVDRGSKQRVKIG